MDKRYQVFVSSTFHDLEKERQEVMHALLELDCMPAGMELFPAANDTQWDLIKRVIDDCDYYILIIAGRYGTIGPDGKSYTEMEYHYALSKEKPILAFLHRSPGRIASEMSEQSEEARTKLNQFRALIERRLCKHWETPQELGSVVSRSLVQLIRISPGIGWVRANELAGQEAMMELLRLRRRVEELNAQLASARVTAPKESEGLAQGDEEYILAYTFQGLPGDGYWGSYEGTFAATWNGLFSWVAPVMINEADDEELKTELDRFVERENENNTIIIDDVTIVEASGYKLNQSDFQTIKIQLRSLGLITKSNKQRSVKDARTYWTLTPYGDEVMTRLRAILSSRTTDAEKLIRAGLSALGEDH